MPSAPKTDTSTQVAWHLLKEAIPPRWKLYVLSLICMIGVAGFTAALAYSTKLIVNEVFVADAPDAAWWVAALVIGVAGGKSLFHYANGVLSQIFNRSIAAGYQKAVFDRIVGKDVAHFAGIHAAKKMNEVLRYGRACATVVVAISNKLLTDVLTLGGLIAVMVWQDPLMSLFALALFPLIMWMISRLSTRIRAVANDETRLAGVMHAHGLETIEGIRTVKSFGLEDKSRRRFARAVHALEDRILGIARVTAATVPLMEFLGGIVLGLFVVYASWQTSVNDEAPGQFTAFITAFLLAYQPAERVSKTLVDIQKSVVHAAAMYALMNAPVRRREGTRDASAVADSSVVLDGVSFAYPEGPPALHDISLRIEPGERVAVVGRSGAGKTTLIDLVQRFYDPSEGVVRIGGTDLRELSDAAMRDTVALTSQDVFLFEGTIRDNIRDGRREAGEDEIARAAGLAGLTGDGSGLPGGLDTEVGPNGAFLSGGQKQRVGIARALVKRARVYVFDEATSALDGETERAIMQALSEHARDATMIFVTHRPSTLEWMSRVVFLRHGRLCAFDTPARLASREPAYRALFNIDAQETGAAAE